MVPPVQTSPPQTATTSPPDTQSRGEQPSNSPSPEPSAPAYPTPSVSELVSLGALTVAYAVVLTGLSIIHALRVVFRTGG